jgi:hypothetical protein
MWPGRVDACLLSCSRYSGLWYGEFLLYLEQGIARCWDIESVNVSGTIWVLSSVHVYWL